MLKSTSTAAPPYQGLPVPTFGKYLLCVFTVLGQYPLFMYHWWLPPGVTLEFLLLVYPAWCGLLARWQLVGHVALV